MGWPWATFPVSVSCVYPLILHSWACVGHLHTLDSSHRLAPCLQLVDSSSSASTLDVTSSLTVQSPIVCPSLYLNFWQSSFITLLFSALFCFSPPTRFTPCEVRVVVVVVFISPTSAVPKTGPAQIALGMC